MAEQATASLQRERARRRINSVRWVGRFCQRLVAVIIEGEETGHDCETFGDVSNRRLGVAVEVKGGDNNHNFGIPIRQKGLASQESLATSICLYALCCYKNRKWMGVGENGSPGVKRPRISLLAQQTSPEGAFNLLSGKFDELYLLDVGVMDALEERVGTQTGRFLGKEDQKVIALGRGDLQGFRNPSAAFLAELGLKPREWASRSFVIQTSFLLEGTTYRMRFPLHSLLKRADAKRIWPVLDSDLPF